MSIVRNARRKPLASAALRLDPNKGLGLQHQLRQQLIEAITAGVFSPGGVLPSSRQLARDLGIARNTVVLAYQQLIDEGHIVARERSGLYVSDTLVRGRLQFDKVGGPQHPSATTDWRGRFKSALGDDGSYRCPPNWQKYPYPFVEGRFDTSLFPIAEWREASRLALGVREVHHWATDTGDADDPMLVEEIRSKVLPRRGINAQPNEILITAGSQQALFLITELLADRATTVGVEEPGNPQMRDIVRLHDAALKHLPIDENGLIVDGSVDGCDIVYVTPSHQRPTAVTLPAERRRALLQAAERRDFIVVEDDFECETNYLDEASPALRGMPGGERVIYVANLSRVLAPGLRLGFMVGPPEVIEQARRLRSLASRHPPLNNQRTAAIFLSLGHYDATMLRIGRVFRERLIALRDALNHYLPGSVRISPIIGGTTYWVRGPDNLDAQAFVREAQGRGILVEPVAHYYAADAAAQNVFRMGVTGIPVDRIRGGVAALAQLFYEMTGKRAPAEVAVAECLGHMDLKRTIPGSTILYKTVYGDPCTIEVLADGTMRGRSGYANEDCDTGNWWLEEDFWCRQWKSWAYGEVSRFRIRLSGERIHWINARGSLVDSGILVSLGHR